MTDTTTPRMDSYPVVHRYEDGREFAFSVEGAAKEIVNLRAELIRERERREAAEKDAERYRVIRRINLLIDKSAPLMCDEKLSADLDSVLDAAIDAAGNK